jgi:membrane protein
MSLRVLVRYGRFARYVARRFVAHGCTQMAAALTFATLLALVPALMLMLGIFAASSYFGGFAQSFRAFLFANLVPDAAGRMTRIYVEQFVQHAGQLTVVGTLLVALSVFALFLTLDRSLNGIWQSLRPRPLWWRVVHSSLWIFAGPLLLGVALSFGSWLISFALSGSGILSGGQKFLLHSLPGLINAVALALLYRVTPRAYVPWRHAMASAALIALVLEVMKAGFGEYVRYVVSYRVIYGTFAGFPIFLLWLYGCWTVVLAGAVITAAWAQRAAPPEQALPSIAQRIALTERVLATLDAASKLSVQQLQTEVGAGYDELGYALDRLAALDMIRYGGGETIVRTRKPSVSGDALVEHFLRMSAARR